jgi:hypothetical protein
MSSAVSSSPVSGEPPSAPGPQPLAASGKQTKVIVISTAMLTFISFWRVAAVVLCDLASSVQHHISSSP